jgi:TolB-like protein
MSGAADVFLSYSRDDQATARKFAEAFERAGLSVWWDQTLRSGENYDQVTEGALRDAKAVVVLWSKKSVESRWVRAEATTADRAGTLVPAMIEPCNRPIMFELKHTAELAHWKGEVNDPAWQTFLADVRQITKREAPVDSVTPPPANRKGLGGIGIAIVVVAMLAVGPAMWMLGRRVADGASHVAGASTATVTLAVLPFVNLSSDPEQEYFSDGLTEEILNQLAQVKGLRVTGRTSSFSFKGKNEDLRVIGEKLGVANLLEGSIRKDGKSLRITAQLINAADGSHLWSKTYDRQLQGVFAVQEEIAKDVSRALSITLDVGVLPRAQGGTTNVEAYDKYLRAEAMDSQGGGPRVVTESAALYREALNLDPGFSRAMLGLYMALTSSLVFLPQDEVQIRAELQQVSRRLVETAPDAWWTLGIRADELLRDRKWTEGAAAARAFNAAAPEGGCAIYEANLGHPGEVINCLERARRTDPLSLSVSGGLQLFLDVAGRSGEAHEEYMRTRDHEGDRGAYEFFELLRLWRRSDVTPAAVEEQYGRIITGKLIMPAELNQPVKGKLHDTTFMLAAIRKAFDAPANQDRTRMLMIAVMADHYGDKDLTFAALRKKFMTFHADDYFWLWWPFENSVRTDPRFKELLRELGLVEYFRSSGDWGGYCKPVGAEDFECH